ncbi:hypothetical protein GGTG_09280 [Gaeumannomyces tritici R3-111a-1]|uniref:Uncharacterized protein n=1 Tax=Gaeumannomyces tritici (strain R3-111a-1) TaxID=644352 RepID=J3P6Y4_GAET3|nr:hypothetical protein GGTG_09280 [Gaeumannomyces tritici R3-111a-1]EJT72414.1 hypothetical protein GGTG_09280 [Gaeumannomyces tritici R3-111a-1]
MYPAHASPAITYSIPPSCSSPAITNSMPAPCFSPVGRVRHRPSHRCRPPSSCPSCGSCDRECLSAAAIPQTAQGPHMAGGRSALLPRGKRVSLAAKVGVLGARDGRCRDKAREFVL